MDVQAEILRRLEQCNERLLKNDSDSKKKENKKLMKKRPSKITVSNVVNTSDKSTNTSATSSIVPGDVNSNATCSLVTCDGNSSATCSSVTGDANSSATCIQVTSDTNKYISKRCRKRNKKKRKILEAANMLQNKGLGLQVQGQNKLKPKHVELMPGTQRHGEINVRRAEHNNKELQDLSDEDSEEVKEEEVKKNERKTNKLSNDSKVDNEQKSKPMIKPEVVVYQSFGQKIEQQRKQRHDIYRKIRLRQQGVTQTDERKDSVPVKKTTDLLDTDTNKKTWQRIDPINKEKEKYLQNTEVLDLNQTRLEVRKLVIEGIKNKRDKKSKAQMKIDYLISRGAKPLKNRHIDNKQFLEKKKLDMAKQKEKDEFDRMMGYKVMKKDRSFKRMDKNDIGLVDGQVGRFRRGVQYIKRKELKGIKRK